MWRRHEAGCETKERMEECVTRRGKGQTGKLNNLDTSRRQNQRCRRCSGTGCTMKSRPSARGTSRAPAGWALRAPAGRQDALHEDVPKSGKMDVETLRMVDVESIRMKDAKTSWSNDKGVVKKDTARRNHDPRHDESKQMSEMTGERLGLPAQPEEGGEGHGPG